MEDTGASSGANATVDTVDTVDTTSDSHDVGQYHNPSSTGAAKKYTLQDRFNDLCAENDQIRADNQVLINDNSSLRAEIAESDYIQDIQSIRDNITHLNSLYHNFVAAKSESDAFRDENQTLSSTISDQKDTIKGLETKIDELNEEFEYQKFDNKESKKEIKKLKADKQQLKQQVSVLKKLMPAEADACDVVWIKMTGDSAQARGLVDELKALMGMGSFSEEKNEDESGAVEMEGEDGSGAVKVASEAGDTVDYEEKLVHWDRMVGKGSDYELKW